MCCPTNATAIDDDDCATAEQLQCFALASDDACGRCACVSCMTESFACYDSGNSTDNMLCDAVVQCSRTNACLGDRCVWTEAGMMSMTLDGPCIDEITAAAGGSTQNLSTAVCTDDNPLYDAVTLGACADANCASDCPTRTGTATACM
jgi:hypothetical protein